MVELDLGIISHVQRQGNCTVDQVTAHGEQGQELHEVAEYLNLNGLKARLRNCGNTKSGPAFITIRGPLAIALSLSMFCFLS